MYDFRGGGKNKQKEGRTAAVWGLVPMRKEVIMKKKCELTAPVDGTIVNLADLPDPAFAEGMLGDGIAIEPASGHFYSPCDGVVSGVTDTCHAYSITSSDGLELLLHIGIDTVELKGKGFSPKVKLGDRLHKGDLVAVVDLELLRESGYSRLTPLIITNMDQIAKLECGKGRVSGGRDGVIWYEKNGQ